MNDKIYVIQDRETKMYYRQLTGIAFDFVPDIQDGTHYEKEDMFDKCAELIDMGISIIGWVDCEVMA